MTVPVKPIGVDARSSRLARRAATLSLPVVQTERPDPISFGSGEASPAVLPDMRQAADRALTRYRSETLQYAPPMGLPAMREWLCGYLLETVLRRPQTKSLLSMVRNMVSISFVGHCSMRVMRWS